MRPVTTADPLAPLGVVKLPLAVTATAGGPVLAITAAAVGLLLTASTWGNETLDVRVGV